MSAVVRYAWTQPCCTDCWNERNPGRPAVAMPEDVREQEQCVYCGAETKSGIYVRVDPVLAPFPSLMKDAT